MLDLSGVTLACVDTANHALALRALEHSRRGVRYARVVLVTDALPDAIAVPDGIDVAVGVALRSRDDYSRYVLKSLLRHVETPHVLVIQWDGYVVNPGAFDPAFLECDYIGAKWYWFDDGMRVGNGGFSLRSRRLLEALQDPRITLADAEDITIGRAFRPLLEREYDIRYATEALADRFAFEAAYPAGMPFGFHGLYNFCRVVPPAELAALAARFSDAIASSVQLGQLLRNCIALTQWDAAAALARRRIAALPGDDEARALLARAEAGLATGPRAGRNEPCPCGSGKRYKQCHGALATQSAASGAVMVSSRVEAKTAEASVAAGGTSAAALAQQGLAAHQRGDVDAAERCYRAALERDAGHPLALHYLGVVLHQRGRHADALPLVERSVALVPHEPEFHNNLGLVLAALDRNDAAIAAYRAALARKPGHATAWNNLGLALQASNRIVEAIDAFRSALAAMPEFAHAHWNLALALLAHGDYAEGWREYEWRLRLPELGGSARPPPLRRWRGEDLHGGTLLVSTEQGLGDALQFVRFCERIAARGIRVVVEAPAELRELLATASGVSRTIVTGAAPPPCDAEIPLLSLPYRLGVTAADIVAPARYLRSDPARAVAFAAPARTARRHVGIAWAGAAHHRNDRRRSMPLASLSPLFSLPDYAWHSLQKGPAAVQLAAVRAARDVVPLDPKSDFAQTAALVDALDAVVTVDTSLAHLAAALGKPVVVLLPFAADWRWGIAGERTPWYATARLLRQPAIGDWTGVVASVPQALAAALGAPAAGTADRANT
jgi:tetratricopeptide (TPR) repeat protein